MGAARATPIDISVLSYGGSSILADNLDVSIESNVDFVDGKILTREYQSAQATVRKATLHLQHATVISAPTKATNLDVSAFALGGTAYLGHAESGELSIDWTHAEGKGLSDAWAYPVYAGDKVIAGSGILRVPATSGIMLAAKAFNSTLSDLDMTFSVTINGVSFTFAGLLHKLTHSAKKGDVQKQDFAITGKGTDSGTYPAAPSGTGTIPAIFVNGNAAAAVAFTTKASGGTAYSGNFLPKSMNLKWTDSGLVTLDYTFESQDAIAAVATA